MNLNLKQQSEYNNTLEFGSSLEYDVLDLKTEISKENLSEAVENRYIHNNPMTTYNELINLDSNEDYGENPLHQRLLKVMSGPELANTIELKDKTPEERVEYFFEKINIALIKFYENKLISKEWGEVPEHISKALVPATEIYLLNFLKHNQNKNNIGTLWLAGEISRNSLNSLIDGISGIANKYSYSYSSMKSLLNIADFLSLPQHQHHLKKLDNPYLLYQKVFVEKADIWTQKDLNIYTLSLTEAGLGFLLDQDSDETALAQETKTIKENIKQEIQGIQMVETPETALKILWLIKKADDVLDQTGKLSNNLLETTKNFYKIDESLLQYFWINLFDVINEGGWVKDVFDFALSLLWFSGGIKGLETKFRRGNIENNLNSEKRKFISDVYKDYFDNKSDSEPAKKSWEIISQLEVYKVPQNTLKNLEKKENNIINKLDLDHTQLKSSILDQLEDTSLINIETLSALSNKSINFKGSNYLQAVKDTDGRKKLQIDQNAINAKPDFKEKLIDTYLSNTINHLINDDKYLEKINNSDELAFTLISGIVVGKNNIIEGIKADAIFPSEFYETPYINTDVNRVDISDSTDSSPEINPEWDNVKNKKLNTLSHPEAIIVLESIFWKGPGTDLLIKLSEWQACFITRIIALSQHEWKFVFWTKNPDKNKGQINIWTFQISDTKWEIVGKWNKSLKKWFEKSKELWINYEQYGYSGSDFIGISEYNSPTSNKKNKIPQLDIIAWIGYIYVYRINKYPDIFNKLRNPNINSDEVEKLLHETIQVWVSTIGKEVTKNLNTSSEKLVANSWMNKEDKNQLLA